MCYKHWDAKFCSRSVRVTEHPTIDQDLYSTDGSAQNVDKHKNSPEQTSTDYWYKYIVLNK